MAQRKPVNVIVGRFQPLSLGHFQMGKDLVAENGAPVVYVYIRSKSGENSQFSDSLTDSYMSDLVKKHSHVEDAYAMTGSFIPVVIMELQRRGYEPLLIGAGPDRYNTYNGMVKRMKNIETIPGFAIHELPTRITSATEVREAIKKDDESKFKKLTPAFMHKYYKEMQEELLQKNVVVENNNQDMENIYEGKDDIYFKEIASLTNIRVNAIEKFITDNKLNAMDLMQMIGQGKIDKKDFITAVTGAPNNKYAKEIISKMNESKNISEFESINEAKLPKLKFKEYETYLPSYAKTLDTITDYVEDSGYFFNQEDFFNAFGDAFFKPRKGATQSKTITIYKDKATTDAIGNLHISIYNRGTEGNTFELTMYHDQIMNLKEGVAIQRKIVRMALESIFNMLGRNNHDAKEELYKLVEEFFGKQGIKIFEGLTEVNNEAIKKSHDRLLHTAWALKNREIAESDLGGQDKETIIKLSKMPSDFFKKLRETLETVPFYSMNEMDTSNIDYLQKINMATMMLIKTNRPFSFEDYCTCMKKSQFIKQEFVPMLIQQGLSDYQIERFIDNLLKVSYFHYTNYFLGHPGRQYVKSLDVVQESEEVNEMKDGVDYKTKEVHISDIKYGDTVIHKGEMKTVGKKDIKHGGFEGSTLFGDSYKSGKDKVTLVLFKRDWDKLKESEKKQNIMKKLSEIEKELNEATDMTIQKVADVIQNAINQGISLMGMRKELEKIFNKRDIDFSFSPQAHFTIKVKGKQIVIINKAYVDDADAIVGDYAIGYL